MAYKSKRAKATAISQKTKRAVWERDRHQCIYCGSVNAFPEAHVLSRQKGGLGCEKNIVTLCRPCHYQFDAGTRDTRENMMTYIKAYLRRFYGEIKESEIKYIPEWKRGLSDDC